MAFVILLSGGVLLALPGLLRGVGGRVSPRPWARLCAGALLAGAVMVELTAVLLAAPTVFAAIGVPSLAVACQRLLGPLTPGGPVTGWVSAFLAVGLPALGAHRLVIARRGYRALEVEPGLGEHCSWQGYELVVLPTDEVLAFSMGGRCSQIVVSRGLVAALSYAELNAVLRHEAAHLEHRHQSLLLLATVVERALPFLPPVRRSTRSLRTALERWADEEAAGAEPQARRDLRAALLGVTGAALDPTVAAFSAADGVMERLRALESPPVRRGPGTALLAPGLVLGLLGLAALGIWMGDLQVLIAMSGRCPL